MKTFFDCWVTAATTLFSQALAGEPQLIQLESIPGAASGASFVAEVSGDVQGRFTVTLDPEIVKTPLLGEGIDQSAAWAEFLREIAEAAAGELLPASGKHCRIEAFHPAKSIVASTHGFQLRSPGNSWNVLVQDEVRTEEDPRVEATREQKSCAGDGTRLSPGIELLLDVELEAALRFGCCEMPLGEILELGPGDVVELDRHVTDPVDLVIGDKIVARGEVVLVNGNFGLRVTEVAAPQRRLESIRCLF